jgi:cytochrome d ubiquinol oxidase subunit II
MVEGLPITNGHYIRGDFRWLSPFAVLCEVGICVGYSLLGACRLDEGTFDRVVDPARMAKPYVAVGR